MEVKIEKELTQPAWVISGEELYIKASAAALRRQLLLLKGLREDKEGALVSMNRYEPREAERKVMVWIQNNIRTNDITTGEKWQEFAAKTLEAIGKMELE